ncbi:MAG TPA: hypothetical protein PKK48_04735 [Phycisphaerae bacterium]|nr:hypothetical protein [Phycisphaerae bacterium]HPS52272.1 hypothetical protein [Phycisphaerae bacterium]
MARLGKTVLSLAVCLVGVSWALAEDAAPKSQWLYAMTDSEKTPEAQTIDTMDVAAPVSEEGWKKPIPVSFSVDYTLVSDYIFRGINFSEYPGEGREKPNNQMTVGTELDLGSFGYIGGSVWFEWFAGQEHLNSEGDSKNLQEVDYTVYYGYNIESIGVNPEIGFIWYEFPRCDENCDSTQELTLNLAFDESVWLRAMGINMKESILNPYLFMAFDLNLAAGASYYETGLSHDFALADLGCSGVPVFKDITLTPSWSMSWQHNWLNKFSVDSSAGSRRNFTSMNNMQWGLDLTYNIKNAFNIPDKYCGEMYVKGFIYYSQALQNQYLNDEFWGGMSVGYSW